MTACDIVLGEADDQNAAITRARKFKTVKSETTMPTVPQSKLRAEYPGNPGVDTPNNLMDT